VPAAPRSSSPSYLRPAAVRLVLILAALVVAAGALATRALPGFRARSLPTAGAQWIWRPVDRADHSPAAFYAVRDFSLAAPPARARLLITADEEYGVTLNAKRIGAGAFDPDQALDVYEVGPLLLPGGNRLLVELRSGRGTGGLLASLIDEDSGAGREKMIVGSDALWRTFPRHDLGLVRGWSPLGRGTPAQVWGYPPLGRWGMPRVGEPKALLAEAVGKPLPAAVAQPFALPATLTPSAANGAASEAVLYDWGRPVEGYLTLAVPAVEPGQHALLFTGDVPPDPLRARPDAPVLIQSARRDWMDAVPRRFRYALLVGLDRPATAAVLPLPPGTVRPPARVGTRVFGIAGPPLRTPVEDEVWSKLQRLAGVAGGKEL
jgi:hypothetical protein